MASAVGLLCLPIFGCRHPRSRDYAVDLGIALQLTNILRDVPHDLVMGRVYLPQDEMERFNVTRPMLGMPNAGEPNTGGCQIFLTHLPTPHLDGRYTRFGRVADGLDVVHEVHCLVGAVDRTRFRSAPPLGFGYAIDTLLDEFSMPSAVFRGGEFAFVPPLDPRERLEVRFPKPVGTMFVDTTLHSEVATLPLSFASRGVRQVTFRQGFEAVVSYRALVAYTGGLESWLLVGALAGAGVLMLAVVAVLRLGRRLPLRGLLLIVASALAEGAIDSSAIDQPTTARPTTAAVAKSTLFRRANLQKRYQLDGGQASTGSSAR